MSEMKPSALLVRLGGTAFALLAGALAIAGALVATQVVAAAAVNWNLIVLAFGGPGVLCLAAALVTALWEPRD